MQYSTLIPAFNAASTLRETIASVVGQTTPPAEIIVVDDGSTDGTPEIALGCGDRVRVVRQKNNGVGSATTTAIREASCPIIAAVDADDLWLPTKMAVQLAYLETNPDCHAVFTHLRTFRADGREGDVDRVNAGWSRTTLVMRTNAARCVGAVIDPPGSRGDMVDWIARARECGLRLDMLDEVLALRRIRPGSLSYGRDGERDKGYVRVAWLALQRRRKGAQ